MRVAERRNSTRIGTATSKLPRAGRLISVRWDDGGMPEDICQYTLKHMICAEEGSIGKKIRAV